MHRVIVLTADQVQGRRLAAALGTTFLARTIAPEPLSVANAFVDHDVALIDLDWIGRLQAWLSPAQMRCVIAVTLLSDGERCSEALDRGAADCVSLAISARELVARVDGLIKRQAGLAPGRTQTTFDGVWTWNAQQHRLRSPAGVVVEISGYDVQLLLALLKRPDRVLSRSFLAALLSRGQRVVTSRTVDVAVSRLRQKLACHEPTAWHVIATNRDEGYSLNVSVFPLSAGVTGFRLR